MSFFYLDERKIPFTEGDNILKAALEAGVAIPHFCYHAALGSLGACRLCAVEIPQDKKGKGPRVTMSCLEPAREGMRVSLSAAQAVRARQGVIEMLMTNHPHDCPVCDEGGECHLQDMTVACGPAYRRYRGRKRTFPNQDLGPLVHHEMNRCITCYLCTRFYRDYALGTDLGAMRLRNEMYFGRFTDGPLESPFAGNLVEICPTGVFTDKVFRRSFARVWDLETAPSICPHCSVGCNILPGARQGTLRRVRNRHHPDINRYFICDRGRYGHAYSEHPGRPLLAHINGVITDHEAALSAAAEYVRKAGKALGVLASAREDLECLAIMNHLARKTGGIFAAFSDPATEAATEAAVACLRENGPAPCLAEIEQSDAVLVVGDLTGHAPMMDLAVRQAVSHEASLALLHSTPAPLARFCSLDALLPPGEIPAWMDGLYGLLKDKKAPGGDDRATFATALLGAGRPLFLGVAEAMGVDAIHAMTRLAAASKGRVAFALPGPDACGAALFHPVGGAEALLDAIEAGRVKALLVAGQDPVGSGPLAGRWQKACGKLDTLIVLDCINTATVRAADILLPVAAWAERSGIFVNYEGRVQAFGKAYERHPPLPAGAETIRNIAQLLGLDPPDATALLHAAMPGFYIPLPGDPGRHAPAIFFPARRRSVRSKPKTGDWQAALCTWYGEDALAGFAPDLAGLAPKNVVRMSAHAAGSIGAGNGARLVLRGGSGSVEMKLVHDPAMAESAVGLSRQALSAIGAAHGDFIRIEAAI